MSLGHGTSIIKQNLVFAWDGMNPKSWDGSSSTHYDLIGRGSGTKSGASALSRSNGHVSFTGVGTRVCTINFPNANITVPTGAEGTWLFAHNMTDAGNQDHVNFGKETGSNWDGVNGFVFGTGWGTDGPRWGIGGTAYQVYNTTGAATGDYRFSVWQMYCITYIKNTTSGLKTYLLDSNGGRLVDSANSSNADIGSNTNDLIIGATNSRGGNLNGLQDCVYMWNVALTATQVDFMFNALKGRFGL